MTKDVLTDEQRRNFAALLNQIIPSCPERSLPGAGEAGVGADIETSFATSPELRLVVEPGLAAFQSLLTSASAGRIDDLAPEQLATLVAELQSQQPALLPTLTFHAYISYYQKPEVQEALGIPPRPPHPEGYEMEPFDDALLETVQKRPKLYRPA